MIRGDFGVWGGAARGAVIAGLAGIVAACQSTHAPPPRTGPLIVAPVACADFTVTLYFAAGSATIGREAQAVLDVAGARTRGCSITGVRVRGLADTPGGRDVNLALSKQRAQGVTRALHRRGFGQVQFQVSAAGDAPGADSDQRMLRRRVDVDIHLGAP